MHESSLLSYHIIYADKICYAENKKKYFLVLLNINLKKLNLILKEKFLCITYPWYSFVYFYFSFLHGKIINMTCFGYYSPHELALLSS